MIKPYFAVALQAGHPDILTREDVKKIAIPRLSSLIDLSIRACNWELPVRLVALPESCFEGWKAESIIDHVQFCHQMAAEPIPNEETELLGEIARRHNIYLMACRKVLDPEIIEDRYFNIAFLIDPEGKVILKHYKLQLVTASRTTAVQDVWDAYVRKYGDGLDAFFQVADTDIGRIGLTICMEGSFPEIYRGFAMQGAEIMYRPSFVEPWVSGPGTNWWEIQNRARALDNNFFMICPNTGPLYVGPNQVPAIDHCGGHSMIVDYRGQMLSCINYTGEGYACAKINIEELRDHHIRAQFGNWLPLLRTECYRKIYDKPIYPKNIGLEKAPGSRDEYEVIVKETIGKLQEQGIFLTPSE